MIVFWFTSQQQNVFFTVSMLIFSVFFFYIVLIDFRSMEFSKMSPNITFGMDVAGGGVGGGLLCAWGASGVLLSQAA
jgi:uncharacterized membrane protein (DUF485 family)